MIVLLRWYVGLGKDKDGHVIHSPHRLVTVTRTELAEQFGGSTDYEARGAWKDSHGRLVLEPAIVFEVILTDQDDCLVYRAIAERVADRLRSDYHQSAVLWTAQQIEGSFVE